MNSKSLTDVPLGGQRNFAYLARLSPGVLPAEPGARDSANGGFSAGGVRGNGQNNFLLNGVDNNVNTIDFLNQTSYAVGPSVEAISEMSVQTNGFNAEYGRAAGAVINVNLKSGSNQLHGSLFEILQNKDLNANSWTNNQAGKPRGPYIQNQFGATAGGPIIKNKLFIFGDYQGTRIASSGGIQGLGFAIATPPCPTPAMKAGDFSSILGARRQGTDANGNPINFVKGAIYDPLSTTGPATAPVSRTAFPGNHHSRKPLRSRIQQAAATVSRRRTRESSPAPSRPATTSTTPPAAQLTDQGDTALDYRLSDKDSLFGSMSWGNTNKTQRRALPGRSRQQRLQRHRRNRSQPQRPDQLHASVDPNDRYGNPRQLHSPGDVARRSQSEHRSVQGVRNRRVQSDHGLHGQWRPSEFLRQRLYRIRRRPMGPDTGIQQRLGLCAERRHQQGLPRDQDRRGIPPGEVPVLPGSRSSRDRQLHRQRNRLPVRRRLRLSGRPSRQYGRCDRFRAARTGGQCFHFDDELHLVAESRLGRICSGRLEDLAETDRQHRSSLRALVARSARDSADRRTSICRP